MIIHWRKGRPTRIKIELQRENWNGEEKKVVITVWRKERTEKWTNWVSPRKKEREEEGKVKERKNRRWEKILYHLWIYRRWSSIYEREREVSDREREKRDGREYEGIKDEVKRKMGRREGKVDRGTTKRTNTLWSNWLLMIEIELE